MTRDYQIRPENLLKQLPLILLRVSVTGWGDLSICLGDNSHFKVTFWVICQCAILGIEIDDIEAHFDIKFETM